MKFVGNSESNGIISTRDISIVVLMAAGINLILFLLFFLFAHPAYYSDEDFYIAYLFAGGFGNPPSELLHYDYGLHPLLGIVIKLLFEFIKFGNWYTITLIFTQYISLTVILFHLLRKSDPAHTLLLYIVLFVIYEGWLLMNIGFNSASLTLTSAGLVLLLEWQATANASSRLLYWSGLFFLFASFFRIHVMVPIIGFSLPILISPFGKKRVKNLGFFFIICTVLIFVFNAGQKFYYKENILGWQSEESYRQLIYKIYNDSRTNSYKSERFKIEFDLIKLGLPADPDFLTKEKLEEMYKEIKSTIPRQLSFNKDSWYWFIVNGRLYFYLVLLIPISIWNYNTSFIPELSSILLLFFGLFILAYLAKSNEYFYKAGIFLWLIFIIQKKGISNKTKYQRSVILLLLGFFLFWGLVRIKKMSAIRIDDEARFKKYYNFIYQNPGKLFINTSWGFPISAFPIMEDPRSFPLKNFLGNEHFLMRLYPDVLKKFGISAFHETPLHSTAFILGKPTDNFLNYFELYLRNVKAVEQKEKCCIVYSLHADGQREYP